MTSAVREYYDHSRELHLRNPWYLEQVGRFLLGNLRSDAASDLSSKKLISRARRCRAVIRTKQAGVIAGIDEVTWLLRHEGITVRQTVADGAVVPAGKIVLKLSGNARTLLAVERTVVNAMQRLSGIATITKRAVNLTGKSVAVAATRKTIWGALDKRAVALGGGLTHRLHLGDGIMVKDNHVALCPYETLQKMRLHTKLASLEISSLTELKRAVIHYPQFHILLLDNFSIERLRLAVRWLEAQKLRRRYVLETSGGIKLANIARYAKTGIDVVSLGELTHSAPALDLSLDIIP